DCYPWGSAGNYSAKQLVRFRVSRGGDGLMSTILLRPISRRLSFVFAKIGVTPNAVSVFSFIVAFAACLLIALRASTHNWLPAALLLLSLILDCSDGEVARLTSSTSELGAWLDAFTDRF